MWEAFEEGKMSSISEGVRLGAMSSQEKVRNLANNVANYINMKEAGHLSYGLGYVTAQVNNIFINDQNIKLLLNKFFSKASQCDDPSVSDSRKRFVSRWRIPFSWISLVQRHLEG